MEDSTTLRRSKSLKRILSSRTRRDSVLDVTEDLPTVKLGKPTVLRVQQAAAKDDIGFKPIASLSFQNFSMPTARNTWPQELRERKPGSHAFEQPPTLVKTPWEQDRSLRSAPRSSASTTRSSIPSSTLARLPREILHCVLDQLYLVHSVGSQLDATSYRNDVRNLCVTNKQWHRVAREHLYREIWLPWSPKAMPTREQVALLGFRPKSRLSLLLQTLQESPGLARLVRRLCVPSAIASEFDCETYLGRERSSSLWLISAMDTISEIIRACKELRAFSGHCPLACDRTEDLWTALVNRSKLEEHVWKLPRSPFDWSPLHRKPSPFVNMHVGMRNLQTLVIWEEALRSDGLGQGTISAMMQRLPSLRHLMLKNLSRSEFHNGTLLMLPALKSLRLEDLPGVTDHGMQQLVYSRLAMSLERLSLVDLELTSLRTVQALLESLTSLRKLSLTQKMSPQLQEGLGFSFTGTSFSLSSGSLEILHWNALLPGASAPVIIANAIAAGKFPKLRSVKIPCDCDGAVQKLCRPIRRRALTEKELREHEHELKTGGLEYGKTTQFMQIEAQLRAKRAASVEEDAIKVTVADEEGVEQFQWAGSYLGNIASNIEYSTEPDIEGQHFSYARIEDLSRPSGLRKGYEQAVGLDVLS